MIDNKPNIFEFATKELSQDAVFCYILDCFHSEKKKHIAEKFLKLIEVPKIHEISELNIIQQEDNIDIKVILRYKDGSSKYIIIEDKVYSSIHDNQLKRYKKATIEREGCREEDVLGRFFKIGSPSNREIKLCNAASFTVLEYKCFLEFLGFAAEEDTILDAFYAFFRKRTAYFERIDSCSFEMMEESLFHEVIGYRYGQRKLTEWIVRKIFDTDYRDAKLYDVNNYGSPCTQYEFIFDNEAKASDWDLQESEMIRREYCCFFRVDLNANGWYIAIRQYFRHGAKDEESVRSSEKRNQLLDILGEDNAPNRKASKEKTLLLYNVNSFARIIEIIPKLKKAAEYLISTN